MPAPSVTDVLIEGNAASAVAGASGAAAVAPPTEGQIWPRSV